MNRETLSKQDEILLDALFGKEITPDLNSRELEILTKKTANEIPGLVKNLESRNLLAVGKIDKYTCCPSCENIFLLNQTVCPECLKQGIINSDIRKMGIYSHKNGSHNFKSEKFGENKNPICPHCDKEVEKEYKTFGTSLKCNKGDEFSEAKPDNVKYTCTSCGSGFLFREAKSKEIKTYVLSEDAKKMLIKLDVDVSPVLESAGYDVEWGPMTLKGNGSETYSLERRDIVGRKNGKIVIVRTGQNITRMEDYMPLYVIARGTGADAYCVAKASEIKDAEIKFFEIPVVVGSDKTDLSRKFSKVFYKS